MAKSIVAVDGGIVRVDNPLQARSGRLELAMVIPSVAKRSVGGEIEARVLPTLGHLDKLQGQAARGVELGSYIVKTPKTVQRRTGRARVVATYLLCRP
jgi:hypothetical protein